MKKTKTCPRFRPYEAEDGAMNEASCSRCAFFSAHNCHKSAFDYLEPEDELY